MSINQSVHNVMLFICLPKIKRYLKISDLRSKKDSKNSDWYTKVKSIYSGFLKASQQY